MTLNLVSFCLALLLSSVVSAADFRVSTGVGDIANYITIEGEIKQGDYERFQRFIIQPDNFWAFANNITLMSPGGNVTEALKFANLFENASVNVTVVDKCYSSCFIMYAGAVHRTMIGTLATLGVHRISLSGEETNFKKARNLISPQATTVKAYLSYLGVPSSVLDKMNETPASSLYKMDHFTLKDQNLLALTGYQPIFLDIVEKSCGTDPDPYPGEWIAERARSPQVMQAIGTWAACAKRIRSKNFTAFVSGEYKLLQAGKPSILFPPNSLAEVEKNVF